MLKAIYQEYNLKFKKPAGTSRGVMNDKHGYLIKISSVDSPEIIGIGECSFIPGLSHDDRDGYEEMVKKVCSEINRPFDELIYELKEWPSIQFGLEMAIIDLSNGGKGFFFDSPFTRKQEAILINGLVWMNNREKMLSEIDAKIADGFKVIKLKVGAINFNDELDLLKHIRLNYSKDIVIRLDANGAFKYEESIKKLHELSKFGIHSIEQPIKAGNHLLMKEVCKNSPIPVALDEELIGHQLLEERRELLETIQPQYIILKPSLVGGFKSSEEWIMLADQLDIGWWITSALESNIGLNAIAQWTSTLNLKGLAQGLGTGGLYKDNFDSSLYIEDGKLWMA